MNPRKTPPPANPAAASPDPAALQRLRCRPVPAASAALPSDRPRGASPRRLPALPWPGADPLFDSLRAELGL